jgi:TRAP-type C4-dicarboxylate transport system substrate-binding protein
MKKITLTLVICLMASGFSYAASEQSEETGLILKMATLQPRGSTVMKIIEKLRAEVKTETNNEADFKFYWGGVQGDEDDVLRKMRVGQLHGGIFSGHGLGRIVPETRVTQLPYIFRNREEVTYVRAELEDTMDRLFEDAGYVVMAWGEAGFVYMFSEVPLTSPEVLREQKCWVWGDDPLGNEVYRTLGVNPVPLSFTDVLTSLSAKLVDAAPITPFGAVAFRWYTRFKYMTEYPVVNSLAGMVVTKDMWDKISPENQQKILKISKRYYDELIRINREENDKSIEALKKAGIKVVRSDQMTMGHDFLVNAGKKAANNLIGKLYSKELLDRTFALLDEYRRNHPDSTYMRIEQ